MELDERALLEDTDELAGFELETVLAAELFELPTMPNGAGWPTHVEVEIQLLLFSQPHPLGVVTHNGKRVPYQLHCWPLTVLLATLLETELDLELAIELATELTTELDFELATELDELATELFTELVIELDELAPLQVDAFNCAPFLPTPATCPILSFTHCGVTGE